LDSRNTLQTSGSRKAIAFGFLQRSWAKYTCDALVARPVVVLQKEYW